MPYATEHIFLKRAARRPIDLFLWRVLHKQHRTFSYSHNRKLTQPQDNTFFLKFCFSPRERKFYNSLHFKLSLLKCFNKVEIYIIYMSNFGLFCTFGYDFTDYLGVVVCEVTPNKTSRFSFFTMKARHYALTLTKTLYLERSLSILRGCIQIRRPGVAAQ